MLGGGGIVRPPATVRYLPLGSPWSASNRLFSALCTRSGHCGRRVRWGGVVPGVVRWGGYQEGAIPGTQPVPTREPLIGIARAQPMDHARYLRPLRHSRALQAPPHTSAPRTQICLWEPNKARFQYIYLKVSL